MAVKDRKRTRFNKLGAVRLGYKVWWCKCEGSHAKKSWPTRWNGDSRQKCERCGKVRTGLTDRNMSPYQSSHFVLWDAPDVLAFYEAQGIDEKDVREIGIMFPFADRDQNFIANYQVWTAADCICQGDGELVNHARPLKAYKDDRGWHVKKEDGETLVNNGMACRPFDWNGTHFDEGDHVPCSGSGDERLYPHCNMCKLNSMLKVMMADPNLFRMGYYRIATGSGQNYDHLDTMFDMLPENVQGIPFKLRLVERETRYTDDGGQDHKTKKWFLQLEPDPDYMRRLFGQRAEMQLGQGVVEETPQLEAPKQNLGGDRGDGIEWYENDDGDLAPFDLHGNELYEYEAGKFAPRNVIDEPPPDEKPQQDRPDFSDWKPGAKWTAFCKLAVERFDCFSETAAVWRLLTSMHEDPPTVDYDVAWTTCQDHDSSKAE